MVISTVNSLGKYTIKKYTLKMFEKYKIGDKHLNNGVLIIVSTGDRKIRIEVGYELENIITDDKAGQILDSAMKELHNDEYSKAILKIFNAVCYEIAKEYSYEALTSDDSILKQDGNMGDNSNYNNNETIKTMEIIVQTIEEKPYIIIILVIYLTSRKRLYSRKGGGGISRGF